MDSRARTVSRLLPFGASVVWDALTDPVLVQGWLAPEVTPVVNAGATLALDGVPLPGASAAILRSRDPGVVAILDLDRAGEVRFEIGAREPLPNGRSQCLLVATATPAHELAAMRIVPALDARLTALHELLRGRPVDWGTGSAGSTGDGAGARA